MFRVTSEISQKFKCTNCDNFLSAKPINGSTDNTQICSLCYEVLSDEDKEKYVPQTVFERIAELFIFPCRYKNNGCEFEYIFDQRVEHEKDCRFKFDKTPAELTIGNKPEVNKRDNYIGRETSACESVCITSEEINFEVDFQTFDNSYVNGSGTHHVKYSFRIQGKNGYQLYLRNPVTNLGISYEKVIGEGILSLEIPKNAPHNIVNIESETETNTSEHFCENCQNTVEDNLYYCLFGHDACKNCKGKTCILCQTVIMGESKSYCRNRHKGCTLLENSELLLKHEIDCEFNNFRCPFPRCVFLNTLSDLKSHFLHSHRNNFIQGDHVSETLNGRKDKKWFVYYCDNLFVCTYFYFVTTVEFMVQYVGANDRAKLFQFEVNVQSKKRGNFKKRAECAGWNDISLCRGVCYEYEDLADWEDFKFQVTVDLRIMQNAHSIYSSL